jgi:tetraacyldisaccharide 4'-kinase
VRKKKYICVQFSRDKTIVKSEMLLAKIDRIRSNILFKPFFFVICPVYCFIVSVRNALFDRHILRVKKFDIPIISVGNLSVGGRGKTPFTMELIDLLNKKYRRIAVISRGYKRRSRKIQLVSDGQSLLVAAENGGDEPVLIARRFPGCLVLVSKRRGPAIQIALRRYRADLVILDDAFQHRWVKRKVDIVLLSKYDFPPHGKLLPLGNLREPLTGLRRANLIMMVDEERNQNDRDYPDLRRYYRGEIGFCHRQVACLVNAALVPAGDLSRLSGQPVVAFAGIANPDSFSSIIQQAGIDVRRFLVFPDHHFYSENDRAGLKRLAREEKCTLLLTTEKDMVKLSADQFSGFNLLAVRIRLSPDSPSWLQQKLYEFIDKTG